MQILEEVFLYILKSVCIVTNDISWSVFLKRLTWREKERDMTQPYVESSNTNRIDNTKRHQNLR